MFKKILGLGFPSTGKNAKDIAKHIESLVQSGAGEFFTGYNPPYWHQKFGFEVSPNGRFAEHEQITDIETLKTVVAEAHRHGIEIFLNLNAWYYTDETFPLIQEMYAEILPLGFDGIICGNISILEYLKEQNYLGKINISTILAAYNSENIRFFLDNYRVNKVILSREVTLKEIEIIAKEFPNLRFEVFGEGDFCRYNNGLCFAEHKYGAKDICTVVQDDLVVRKRFRPDFKKILGDEALIPMEKVAMFDEHYESLFWELQKLLEWIEYSDDRMKDVESMKKIVKSVGARIDVYFDAMKPLYHTHNQGIIAVSKALKYLLEQEDVSSQECEEYMGFREELEHSIKTGLQYLKEKTLQSGGAPKLRALTLANTYAKGDALNLYSYLFFSQFPNIDTVKFPTRGRNYGEKIKKIEEVLQLGEVPQELIDRGSSLERTHYDLSYLFGEKLWFRTLLSQKT